MADIRRVPNMGVAEFAKLNYTSKKSYNVRGIGMQMESVVPAIGLSLLFNRTFIVSSEADAFRPRDGCSPKILRPWRKRPCPPFNRSHPGPQACLLL